VSFLAFQRHHKEVYKLVMLAWGCLEESIPSIIYSYQGRIDERLKMLDINIPRVTKPSSFRKGAEKQQMHFILHTPTPRAFWFNMF
jgi:hypothetical protein